MLKQSDLPPSPVHNTGLTDLTYIKLITQHNLISYAYKISLNGCDIKVTHSICHILTDIFKICKSLATIASYCTGLVPPKIFQEF